MLAPAFLYNSGIIRFASTPFAVAAGATSAALLDRHGNPIGTRLKTVTTMHRTDWQGRVALSASPRTNYIWPSDGSSRWGFNENANATITYGESGPTGANDATKVVVITSSGGIGPYVVYSNVGLVVGTTYIFKIALRGAVGGEQLLLTLEHSNVPAQRVTLTTDWKVYEIVGQAGTTGAFTVYTITALAPVGMTFWYDQGGAYDVDGPIIPTTSAPVTVTDYAVDAGGNVTLGQAPVTGATLDWDGVAQRG